MRAIQAALFCLLLLAGCDRGRDRNQAKRTEPKPADLAFDGFSWQTPKDTVVARRGIPFRDRRGPLGMELTIPGHFQRMPSMNIYRFDENGALIAGTYVVDCPQATCSIQRLFDESIVYVNSTFPGFHRKQRASRSLEWTHEQVTGIILLSADTAARQVRLDVSSFAELAPWPEIKPPSD